jgi:hypothetical protein
LSAILYLQVLRFQDLYEDVLISEGYNPNEAKILAARYRKNEDQKNEGANMPVQPSVRVCTHIKVTGIRCGSPALRGEQFCYFHQRMVRGVRTPPQARLHPIALIEDRESIQASLMEVINALIRNHIDTKRAELILRALHIAVKNAHRIRFESGQSNMVKEIPDYPAKAQPPKPTPAPVVDPADAYGFTGVPSSPPHGSKEIAEAVEAERAARRKPPSNVKQATYPSQRKNRAHSSP